MNTETAAPERNPATEPRVGDRWSSYQRNAERHPYFQIAAIDLSNKTLELTIEWRGADGAHHTTIQENINYWSTYTEGDTFLGNFPDPALPTLAALAAQEPYAPTEEAPAPEAPRDPVANPMVGDRWQASGFSYQIADIENAAHGVLLTIERADGAWRGTVHRTAWPGYRDGDTFLGNFPLSAPWPAEVPAPPAPAEAKPPRIVDVVRAEADETQEALEDEAEEIKDRLDHMDETLQWIGSDVDQLRDQMNTLLKRIPEWPLELTAKVTIPPASAAGSWPFSSVDYWVGVAAGIVAMKLPGWIQLWFAS